MATTLQRSKPLNRPRKGAAARERRNKLHRKRLVALGMPEAEVQGLNSQQMRALLRHPVKTAARYAKS